jgi:hypothetical protein
MRKRTAKLLVAMTLLGSVVLGVSPASAHDCESGSYETGDCIPDTTH